MFTLRDAGPWFPGVWAWNEPCTWKIEVKVDTRLTGWFLGFLMSFFVCLSFLTMVLLSPGLPFSIY